jgi:hypothetical protein
MTENTDKYQHETASHTPLAVDTIRYIAPPTAIVAWVVVILALTDVPDFIIEALLMGLGVPISAIIGSYLGLWTGYLQM